MYMYRVKHRETVMAYFLIYDDLEDYIDGLLKMGYNKEDFYIDEILIEEGDIKHE